MEKLYLKKSPDGYPAFLTEEEEQAVLRQIIAGDRSAKEILIERNLRIVFFAARKYAGPGAEFEDLMSIGSIGLIKAANTFDPEKNVRFSTYASRCVKNEMLMYLRRESNVEIVPFEEQMCDDDAIDIVWEETERRIDRARIEELTALLPEKQRKIAILRFGLKGEKERNQKEVAEMTGVSQSYVSKTEKKFVRLLREKMAKDAQISEKM